MKANLIATAKAMFIIAVGFTCAGMVKQWKHNTAKAEDMYYIAIADAILGVILFIACGGLKKNVAK